MAPVVNEVTHKFLGSGKELVTKVVGNQTSRQLFSSDGELLRTALRKVENRVIPATSPVKRKIGFAAEAVKPAEDKAKEIRTVTKNIFDSVEEKSTARIVDAVYVNGEKVGESVRISESCAKDPMQAMKDLMGGTYKKFLRYFKGGQLEKESVTVMENGKRVSRKISDYGAEREIQAKIKKLSRNIEDLFAEIDKLLKDKEFVKLDKSIRRTRNRKYTLERQLAEYRRRIEISQIKSGEDVTKSTSAEEIKIQIEKLKTKIKKTNDILVAKMAKKEKLAEELGIKAKDQQLCQMIDEQNDLYRQLSRQQEQNRALVEFNGSNLVEKIDDKTFSLTV